MRDSAEHTSLLMSTELLAHSKVLSSLQQECLTLKQRVRQAVLFGEDSEAAPTTTERRSSIPERKGSLGLAHSFSAPRAMEGRKVRQVGFGDDDDDSFGSDPLPPTAERKGSTTGLLSHSFSAKGALDGGHPVAVQYSPYNWAINDGSEEAGERFEWENLADDPAHADVVKTLHAELRAAVATGTVKPLRV